MKGGTLTLSIIGKAEYIISYLKSHHPHANLNKIILVYSNLSGIPREELDYVDAILGLLSYNYSINSIIKLIL